MIEVVWVWDSFAGVYVWSWFRFGGFPAVFLWVFGVWGCRILDGAFRVWCCVCVFVFVFRGLI